MKRLFVHQTYNPQFSGDPRDENNPDRFVYIVDKVTNSTTPQINATLTVIELDDRYCGSVDWEVTIT